MKQDQIEPFKAQKYYFYYNLGKTIVIEVRTEH